MLSTSAAGNARTSEAYAKLMAPPQVNDPRKVAKPDDAEARAVFDQFVGEAFYGQLLSAMRKTVGKAAYFNGGRAEEMFQGQLDQTLAQDLAKNNAGGLTEGMYQLFRLTRS